MKLLLTSGGVTNPRIHSIFPHLAASPTNTLADAERWAADRDVPAYAIDEQTAITVVDGAVEVVSEGQWTTFGRSGPALG